MTRYRSQMIAELASQQGRFAPQSARHRQILQAEALLEDGERKKSDMFFEYRVQEGDEVAQCFVCAHSLLACQRTI